MLTAHLVRTPIDTSGVRQPAGAGAGPEIASAAKLQLPLDGKSLGEFPETVSRPLFWVSRRPAPPQAAPAPVVASPVVATKPAVEPPAVAFRLAGIVEDGGKVRRALISWPQQPEGRWVEVGTLIEGWRLAGIDRHAVKIEAAGRTRELKLP